MAFGDTIQTAAATAQSSSTVSVTISAATAGNLLVGTHFSGDADSQAPTGFTEAVAVTDSPNADQGAIYYKIAAGGETSIQFGSGSSNEQMAVVREYEGPIDSSPVDQTATNGPTTETTTSSGTTGTTTQASQIAVAGICVRQGGSGQFTNWTNSFTEVFENNTNFKALGVADKVLTATGTVETSADHNNASSMGMIATFKEDVGGAATRLIPTIHRLQAVKRVGNF